MVLISEDVYDVILGLSGISTFIMWLLFGRLTMARIEKEIKADGYPRPAPWDGIGARILFYAYIYALPIGGLLNPRESPFVDATLIRRYGTNKDRILAKAFMVTGHLFLIWGLLGAWVFNLF